MTFYKRNCKYCKKYYEGWGKEFCSRACVNRFVLKGKPSNSPSTWRKGKTSGANHPNWKGGKSRLGKYMSIRVGHRKYQLEHRYVMEQHLGRKLKRSEHIHHINHEPLDNRIENLEIIDASTHIKMHRSKDKGSYKRDKLGRYIKHL